MKVTVLSPTFVTVVNKVSVWSLNQSQDVPIEQTRWVTVDPVESPNPDLSRLRTNECTDHQLRCPVDSEIALTVGGMAVHRRGTPGPRECHTPDSKFHTSVIREGYILVVRDSVSDSGSLELPCFPLRWTLDRIVWTFKSWIWNQSMSLLRAHERCHLHCLENSNNLCIES